MGECRSTFRVETKKIEFGKVVNLIVVLKQHGKIETYIRGIFAGMRK